MDLFRNPLDDRREELLDFADRYERGAPYDDISEEEAVSCYREIVPKLSGEAPFRDPDYLTDLTAHMRREPPDLLEGLIGDGGAGLVGSIMGEGITGGEGIASDGGMLGNPVAKAALAGIAAIGIKRMANGR